MLCLPPETLNRRTAPVTSPQPRPARPSRAAGSCYRQKRLLSARPDFVSANSNEPNGNFPTI